MVFLELVDRPIEEKNVESTDSKKEKKEKNTTPEVKDQVKGKRNQRKYRSLVNDQGLLGQKVE